MANHWGVAIFSSPAFDSNTLDFKRLRGLVSWLSIFVGVSIVTLVGIVQGNGSCLSCKGNKFFPIGCMCNKKSS